MESEAQAVTFRSSTSGSTVLAPVGRNGVASGFMWKEEAVYSIWSSSVRFPSCAGVDAEEPGSLPWMWR